MIAISTKPVRECAGCKLDLVKKCAVFEHPVLKWKNRKCEGFNNPELIREYELKQNPSGAYARKRQRTERAKMVHTVVHEDGVRPLRGVVKR